MENSRPILRHVTSYTHTSVNLSNALTWKAFWLFEYKRRLRTVHVFWEFHGEEKYFSYICFSAVFPNFRQSWLTVPSLKTPLFFYLIYWPCVFFSVSKIGQKHVQTHAFVFWAQHYFTGVAAEKSEISWTYFAQRPSAVKPGSLSNYMTFCTWSHTVLFATFVLHYRPTNVSTVKFSCQVLKNSNCEQEDFKIPKRDYLYDGSWARTQTSCREALLKWTLFTSAGTSRWDQCSRKY